MRRGGPQERDSLIFLTLFQRIQGLSIISIVIPLFFFLWALYNTFNNYSDGLLIHSTIDDGLVCFPFNIISGIVGLLSLKYILFSLSLYTSIFILSSYLFTTFVFLFAAIQLNSSALHQSYLIISSIIWGAYGVLFYKEMKLFRDEKLSLVSTPLLTQQKCEAQYM